MPSLWRASFQRNTPDNIRVRSTSSAVYEAKKVILVFIIVLISQTALIRCTRVIATTDRMRQGIQYHSKKREAHTINIGGSVCEPNGKGNYSDDLFALPERVAESTTIRAR
jgi:hypothetical protein